MYMAFFWMVLHGLLRHQLSRDALDTAFASFVCVLTPIIYMTMFVVVVFHGRSST
jgi:hypothetical protein